MAGKFSIYEIFRDRRADEDGTLVEAVTARKKRKAASSHSVAVVQ